jgi:Tfp pilus assembly protein PilV
LRVFFGGVTIALARAMTRAAGFSLIEALVAAAIVMTMALGVAQLFGIAIAQNAVARQQLIMGVAAAAKIDELSAALASGSLGPSPADALERTAAGWADTILASGRSYNRRWRIAGVPGYAGTAYSIVVRVSPVTGAGGDVRLGTIRAGGTP